MNRVIDVESREMLERHGIPFTTAREPGSEQLILPSNRVQPDSLRELGFRLGHGVGEISYLLYFHGHFCGVLKK